MFWMFYSNFGLNLIFILHFIFFSTFVLYSQAAEDSLRLMGNRQFYDQMLQDAMFQKRYKITDEVDVTTLKDYMQVCRATGTFLLLVQVTVISA